MHPATAFLAAAAAAGCASPLPIAAPPLAAFERPVALLTEPDDEPARAALPSGSFSGVVVVDARDSLDALSGAPVGVVVERVVENSPGAAAGLRPGDLLAEAAVGGEVLALAWPSDWRALELDHPAGTRVALVYDRAGAEDDAVLTLVERVAPAARSEGERLRETARVGFEVRTATEVEARAAGLAPGAGAVLVGLAASSPWRTVDLRFGDLVTHVDGAPVAHPEVLIAAVRGAPARSRLTLTVRRGADTFDVAAPLAQRERVVKHVSVPALFSYERDGSRRRWSALLAALRWESTPAAWRLRLLWLFSVGGGDADRLEEVEG